MTHYRDLPEWREVEIAVTNLVKAQDDDRPNMVSDFTISVVRLPEDLGNSRFIGGYSHYSTSVMPHINRGILLDADDYYATMSQVDDEETP